MLRTYITAFLVTTLATHADSASCISKLVDIYNAEKPLTLPTTTSQVRTYTLCPNTTFSPGIADQDTGVISGGDFPLVCRRNCYIKCGTDGSSFNKCKIQGSGTYGIFMAPYLVFDDAPTDAANIVIQGITLELWKKEDQIPVVVASPSGNITYIDCVFKENRADPLFVLDEFLLSSSTSGRNRGLEMKMKRGFRYPVDRSESGPHLSDQSQDMDRPIPAATELGGRRVQTAKAPFRVNFQRCRFELNAPITKPKTQGGLSLIRFRAADPFNSFDQVGSLDASFYQNTFVDNYYKSTGQNITFHSMIDFYSNGQLDLRENCFLSSPVNTFGVAIAQVSSKLTTQNNFVNPIQVQPTVACEFIAIMTSKYVIASPCGSKAEAKSCQANSPSLAPSKAPTKAPATGGGFCFPADATCQVQGQGQVRMSDIKLGDKVLVQGGKYETVYSFGHRARQVQAIYLQFAMAALVLDISKDHMVFVEGGRSIPAAIVKVGDKLLLADGNVETVNAIRTVQKQGAYAPFTASGTVAVNGVVASSFIAFQESETLKIGDMDTAVSFQFLARTFETPHRMWCEYVSACTEETYTGEGVSLWVDLPHKLALWFLEQNTVVMALVGVPVGVGFVCMAYPVAAFMTFAAILWVIGRPLLSRRKSL